MLAFLAVAQEQDPVRRKHAFGERPLSALEASWAPASTRRRVAARICDTALGLAVCSLGLSLPQVMFVALGGEPGGVLVALTMVVFAALFGGWFFLRVVRLVWWGCTVGQRIAGIRVVQHEDGRPPAWGRAFRRWTLPRGKSDLALVTDLLAHRDDKALGQCLHDRRARTVVVLTDIEDGFARERERRRRFVLGGVVAVLAVASIAVPATVIVLVA